MLLAPSPSRVAVLRRLSAWAACCWSAMDGLLRRLRLSDDVVVELIDGEGHVGRGCLIHDVVGEIGGKTTAATFVEVTSGRRVTR